MNDSTFPLLSLTLFLPLAGALIALFTKKPGAAHTVGITTAVLTLVGAVGMGLRGVGGGFSQVEEVAWIPALEAAYRVGVDGISYPLVLLTAVLFVAGLVYSAKIATQPAGFVSLMLLLEMACLGVFLALDLILFYVFFEITLVGMYFIIVKWGHEGAQRAGLLFFLYTLVGSLFLLLALLSLYLHSDPRTFDLRALVAGPPVIAGTVAVLTFWALVLAFAIKTPVFPFHSWLRAAHTAAPAAGSAVLAGILLKLGAYGFIRFVYQMMPESLHQFAWPLLIAGVVSAIYGALVALAQTDLKRMVAYTSVNHMGYLLFAVAAASLASTSSSALALNGATLQMVSHGIVTGMLFLLVGALQDRTVTREMPALNGLLRLYPRLSALFIFGAFASLGLPALAHFPAEFQIFLGGFSVSPWATAVILLGLVLTAALYLRAIQSSFMGGHAPEPTGRDLTARELWAIGPLAVLILLVGLFPQSLLAFIEATTALIAS